MENVHKVDAGKYLKIHKGNIKAEVPSLLSLNIPTPKQKVDCPSATNSKAPLVDDDKPHKHSQYKLKSPISARCKPGVTKPETDSDSEIKHATPRSPWRLSDSSLNSPMIDLNMDVEGNVVLHQRVANTVEMGEPPKVTRHNDTPKPLKAGLVKPKLHRLKIQPNKDKKKFLDNVQLTKNQLQTVVIPTSPTYANMACDPRTMFAGAPSLVRRHFLASPLKKIRRRALKQKETLTTEFSYPSSGAMVKKGGKNHTT